MKNKVAMTAIKKLAKGGEKGFINWNFTKFLVNRKGAPVLRFGPTDKPLDFESEIKKLLGD